MNQKNDMVNMEWIPIVFSATDNYMKYVSVTIESIVKSNADEFLWIYILYTDLQNENYDKMKSMENEKLKIDFIDVNRHIDKSIFFVDGHVTVETYFRLLIPELLPQWDKLIYMDCDIVCMGKIRELYNTEIGENLIAGVITIGNEMRKEYTEKHLGISSINYINAGVLLFNNKELNKINWREKWTRYVKEKTYLRWHDQDVLNVLCYGKILFLDSKWNTTLLRIKKENNYLKENDIKKDKLNCIFLHYASLKPWGNPISEVMLPFWESAYLSPFTSEIIKEYEKISNTQVRFLELCKENKVSVMYLLKAMIVSLKVRLQRKG